MVVGAAVVPSSMNTKKGSEPSEGVQTMVFLKQIALGQVVVGMPRRDSRVGWWRGPGRSLPRFQWDAVWAETPHLAASHDGPRSWDASAEVRTAAADDVVGTGTRTVVGVG